MLVRLLLALLLAAFAVPAPAMAPACHDGPAAMAHHDAPARPHKAPAPHACIGCVPLADWLAERLPAPLLLTAATPQPGASRLDLGGAAPPALPPPRHG